MNKKYPLVSIVLPCFNSINTLDNCLNNLLKTIYPNFEIIIIDDLSTDGSYERIKSFFKDGFHKVKILRNSKNMKPSFTRNRGIKKSCGEFIAFVETDMSFERDWLTKLVDYMIQCPELGAVAGKCCDFDHRDKIVCTGIQFDPATFGVVEINRGKKKSLQCKNFDIGLGAVGTLFRKEVLKKVGGFDQKLKHNIDDIDLSWRIWIAGFEQRLVPEAIIYHKTGKISQERSLPALNSEIINHKVVRIFIKNYEFRNIIKYLPKLISYQLLRVGYNISKGNFKPMGGFILGYFGSLIELRDSLHHRQKIQSIRIKSDKEIIEKIGYKGKYLGYILKFIHKNFGIQSKIGNLLIKEYR